MKHKLKSLTIENYKKCPKCGSENVAVNTVSMTDYLHREQGHPLCNDCGFSGQMGYEKINWGCAEYKGDVVFTKEDVKAVDDEHSMHILLVKINEEYRSLKKDLVIELKPLTLLVGEQGCGKSTLLNLLKDSSDKIDLKLSDNVNRFGIDSFYFDSEKMNPRTADLQANYTTLSGENKGIGVGAALLSHFKSHGEVLKEFTVNRIEEAKDCVLLLDEPETALSLRNQYKLAHEINKATSNNVQLIVATHCLPLIESVEDVYSLEHSRWMPSKEFIKLNQ